ncbi:molybdopterin molybdenumtransferase MoeA [Pseudoflavonifractor sp. 524-17]|uniref:molybdopterin molybdotransferase MoeA n=1 Tax=Pseudoflavonifractor sp. 524-17 TaxID=2304577 RepID=UPI001379760E|nr:gephyrin-like molybdotransferase Glp [Pseudoflavonifractor sp. 524-17]NCE64829.1 molybdopterin molybdenumtransferase MoeA [Pseudoflavonifractor sp. 524-17]
MRMGIELEEALSLIRDSIVPLGMEEVPLDKALGRALAQDIRAAIDQPPFDRSPLDGYALRSADLAGADREHPAVLQVVETVYAGDVPACALAPGQAVRIMTGAQLPQGCDCVIRHEDTDNGMDTVQVYQPLSPCANYCLRGEDYRAGERLISAGARVDAAAVGVLASMGCHMVPVRRRPRVGLLSTGDEVVSPDVHPLPPGKIYGSNQVLLSARLEELGMVGENAPLAGDDSEAVAQAVQRLFQTCDAVITTGGVSVGDKDIFHQVLPLMGAERLFWRVNLKPGTPVMYALYEGKPLLCLSGNPFAAAATFELLARPLLAACAGEPGLCLRPDRARVSGAFPKASKGRRFLRGRYEGGVVTLPRKHESGLLSSLIGCNCLVDLPAGSPPVEDGQIAAIWR